MSGFVSRIMNNSISSLNAQQAVIATTATNISNVNTPGYARRQLEISARGGGGTAGLNVGNGVEITSLQRMTNSFLDDLMRTSGGEVKGFEAEDEYLSRVESLFSLSGQMTTIGSALNGFFAAVDDLSVNPSSIELRSNFIERANDLVTSIRTTYDSIAALQTEADQRVANEIGTINSLTGQIAELNGKIRNFEAAGNLAADERDQRDQLLQKLGEKLSFQATEMADGTVNVTLSNGFPLVAGNFSRDLEVTKSPSFSGGTVPPSLAGGALNYIVYDFSNGAGTAHIDLTEIIKVGDGTVGGLLKIRGTHDNAADTSAFDADGQLVELASRVEAITQQLLTTVNQVYYGPDRDPITPGVQPSSGDLNGNAPDVYGLFTFATAADTNADGAANDLAASGFDNFSSRLALAFSDPRRVAAARDAAIFPAAASFPSGDGRNLEALSAMQNASYTFSAGSHSLTATFSEAYDETVAAIGNMRGRSKVNLAVAEANYSTARSNRESMSGVSLDEEFTNLIKYQKAFEASARLIKVADGLLEQLINII